MRHKRRPKNSLVYSIDGMVAFIDWTILGIPSFIHLIISGKITHVDDTGN
jgi:hypothetical protein